MIRSTLPYVLIAFALSCFAGWSYSAGLIGAPGAYGLGMLAVVVACPAVFSWEQRDHERRSKRR